MDHFEVPGPFPLPHAYPTQITVLGWGNHLGKLRELRERKIALCPHRMIYMTIRFLSKRAPPQTGLSVAYMSSLRITVFL